MTTTRATGRNKEIEIKLSMPNVAAARRLLRGAGFRVVKPRVFEANTVFDTPGATLRKSAQLLRVRQAGRHATVTFKGRPEASKHKSREELELEISDAGMLSAIFERLGFQRASRYEKFRTEYGQPGGSGIATIDETPIGVFVELEGPPRWIDRTARELGFEERDYIILSYGALYLEWRRQRRRKPTDMVFPKTPR